MATSQEHIIGTESSTPSQKSRRYSVGNWGFSLNGDEIAEISYTGVRLITAIRPALRDANWGTVEGHIDEVSVDHRTDGQAFTIRGYYTLSGTKNPYRIDGTFSQNSLRITYTVSAVAELTTNRVGLTTLIPEWFAGRDGRSTTPTGEIRPFRLPRMVSPFQPLFDISKIELDLERYSLELAFEGDTFEMEDQRNWTDASFKIYSRPLGLPFPYRVAPKTQISQSILLTVRSRDEELSLEHKYTKTSAQSSIFVLDIPDRCPRHQLPDVGVGVTTDFSAAQTELPFKPSTMTLEVTDRFDTDVILSSLPKSCRNGQIPMDVRFAVDDEQKLNALVEPVLSSNLSIRRVGVFSRMTHTTTRSLNHVLRECVDDGRTKFVSGARTHFAEFNRNINSIPQADAYCYSVTPEMHVRDTWHINESVSALGTTLATARQRVGGASLIIGPITLRPRINAVATDLANVDQMNSAGYGPGAMADSVDSRQFSSWAGAWTTAVYLTLAMHDVDTGIFYEACGPRGILRDGKLSPAGKILQLFNGFRGKSISVFDGLAREGVFIGIVWSDSPTAIIANVSNAPHAIQLRGTTWEVPPASSAWGRLAE